MRHPLCAWYGTPYYGPGGGPAEDPPAPEEKPPEKQAPEKKPDEKKPSSSRHALVIGRFMPPHAGHQYLVDVARQLAPIVTVLVRVTDDDPIAPALRLTWLRELFGDRVGALTGAAPVANDTPLFWTTWADHVGGALSRLPAAAPVDLVVSSDPQAWKLAELLGAAHACVDPQRDIVPVSAKAIRRDPLAAWAYLPAPVRAHFAKCVVLIGPEGSGKSTFARALAAKLDTVFVPEQARLFAERSGGTLRASQLATIATLQTASIAAAARRANRYVIADTDARSLQLWGERLFGPTPLPTEVPDLYLVTDTTVGVQTHDRMKFTERCLAAAMQSGAPVVRLPADPDERLNVALRALTELGRSGTGTRY